MGVLGQILSSPSVAFLYVIGVALVGLVGRIAWVGGASIAELRGVRESMTELGERFAEHVVENRKDHRRLFEGLNDTREEVARIKGRLEHNGAAG